MDLVIEQTPPRTTLRRLVVLAGGTAMLAAAVLTASGLRPAEPDVGPRAAPTVAPVLAVAPTFGLGLNFFTGRWGALGLEWRGLPFARNTGGFDIRGSGGNKFPDNKVDSNDRQFKFNQMISVSFSIFLPTELKVSE